MSDELIVTSLLAEVKMRGESVLEQVDRAITGEHHHRRPFQGKLEAFRQHLEKRGRHHESCAKGDKVAEIALLPIAAYQHEAAEDVSKRGDASENEGKFHEGGLKESNVQFTDECACRPSGGSGKADRRAARA